MAVDEESKKEKIKEAFKNVFSAFATFDIKTMYIAKCCDRLFVGGEKPSHCRTCSKNLSVTDVNMEAIEDVKDLHGINALDEVIESISEQFGL